MTPNQTQLFKMINACLKNARMGSDEIAADEYEKLAALSDVLETVNNFENKLMVDLDVD